MKPLLTINYEEPELHIHRIYQLSVSSLYVHENRNWHWKVLGWWLKIAWIIFKEEILKWRKSKKSRFDLKSL